MTTPRRDRGTTGRGCAISALSALAAAVALWFALRAATYGGIYRGAAAVLDAFRSPLWLAAVLLLAAAVSLWLFVSRERGTARPPRLAPDVHLRAEPEGSLTVVVAEGRHAAAADIVVPRDPAAEREIRERFAGLAARAAAFGEGRTTAPRGDTAAELRALGRALAERVLGGTGGAAGRIADLSGDHLQLRIQGELAGLPWEHLVPRPDGFPLWRLFHLSRQLRGAGARTRPAAPPARPLRVLLVSGGGDDGAGGLPFAEREATTILETAARRPDVMRVTRKSPQTADELITLLYGPFDILHFAGHAVETGEGRAWVLPGGERAPMSRFTSTPPPWLVFANACGTAGDSSSHDVDETARLILSWGAGAYIGTLWDVDDGGAEIFARAFYDGLARGLTLAAAVTSAREAVLPDHALSSANYVLYGDPTDKLAEP